MVVPFYLFCVIPMVLCYCFVLCLVLYFSFLLVVFRNTFLLFFVFSCDSSLSFVSSSMSVFLFFCLSISGAALFVSTVCISCFSPNLNTLTLVWSLSAPAFLPHAFATVALRFVCFPFQMLGSVLAFSVASSLSLRFCVVAFAPVALLFVIFAFPLLGTILAFSVVSSLSLRFCAVASSINLSTRPLLLTFLFASNGSLHVLFPAFPIELVRSSFDPCVRPFGASTYAVCLSVVVSVSPGGLRMLYLLV